MTISEQGPPDGVGPLRGARVSEANGIGRQWIADWERSERLPHYTRANAGETLPDPASPLGWTLVFEHGLRGWRRGFADVGVYGEDEWPATRPPFVGMFGGYFYLNLSHIRLFSLRMGVPVEQTDRAFVGRRPDIPAYVAHPDDVDEECSAKAGASVQRMLGADGFPEADEDRRRLLALRRERPDLTTLSDADLAKRAYTLLDEIETTFYRHVVSSLPASVGPGILGQLCSGLGRTDDLLALISGLGKVDSASPASGMWDLSRRVIASPELTALFDQGSAAVAEALPEAGGELKGFRDAFEEFLAEHGDRGPNEWDIHAQSWEVAPVQVLALVDRLRHSPDSESPANRHARLAARRRKTADRIREALAADEGTLATFEMAMRAVDVWVTARERTKANCVTAINEIRLAVRELGRRGVEAGLYERPEDVMMLVADELDDYLADPGPFAPVIAERLRAYAELYALEPPFLIADEPRAETWPRRDTHLPPPAVKGDELSGIGGSGGIFTGRARVVTDPADCAALEPGEVLVAPITDAAWTPLFLVAGAVVADVGALNSHAVVVSRELGIPCVVSVGDGTRRLRDGVEVMVDGDAGMVTVLG
ncbi:PEP-utilizing enzyme [Nonomuraea sp. NPDC049480]|uniref:PEP-utilizing enzyme n=1 Tax=Nonomuraea sp. NPDC049480 TaxID=3364353 RepID=UPI003794E645